MTMPPGEGEEDTHQHELVIIRRRSDGEEEGHHGGVWKIAHADFMTALMAFFLVMWLITATDDKTITGIANYFNPMRLSDEIAKPKGVFSMEPTGDAEQGGNKNKKDKQSKGKPQEGAAAAGSEAAMLQNPLQALDQIAAQAGKGTPPLATTERGNVPQHKTGEAFRDPFDPDFQAVEPGEGRLAKSGRGLVEAQQQAKASGTQEAGQKKSGTQEQEKERESLREQIRGAVAQAGFQAIPGIEVRSTPEGLLISITDRANFEMFGIASARPKPELVVLMEKIGAVLAKRPEHLVIRGHTDGRPFRSDSYDNWQLSTARAHMANYMLLRSGIPEGRIAHVEGHADHDLKIADDPYAATNRRIEILLEKAKP